MTSQLLDLCASDNAIVLVIDVQGKIADMVEEPAPLRKTVGKLLRVADLFGVPVLVSEQYPAGLGRTVPELTTLLARLGVEWRLMAKTSFGCCGEPGFNEQLASLAARVRDGRAGPRDRPLDIIVVGIETHVCVQQTVLELIGQGYRAVVLEDGTSSRVPACHRIAVERFRQAGAVVSSFESVAFEWARSKDHARFKAMSAIVKEP